MSSLFLLLLSPLSLSFFSFFFFNHTATTEIYTLSLHDALPISAGDEALPQRALDGGRRDVVLAATEDQRGDRKSTRLNSSHGSISYAVFCLKKKKKTKKRKKRR